MCRAIDTYRVRGHWLPRLQRYRNSRCWEIDYRADVAPGNQHMRYVLFQLAPVWGDDRTVIVTHTRGLELGVFDPQANRIAPDNFGIKLFSLMPAASRPSLLKIISMTVLFTASSIVTLGLLASLDSPCWAQTSSRILPVRAFSTVSSKDDPKSTPMS